MLSQGRIQVECGRIRYVAAGVIGDDGDVVAYLVLLWPSLCGIECCAYRDVRRPRRTCICAVGIKQLRLKIVPRIARVIPDGV